MRQGKGSVFAVEEKEAKNTVGAEDMDRVYYNENSFDAIQFLQIFMGEGIIPKGVIDTRSIKDVQKNDLKGFKQCHFFAGIGGWAMALQAARWPEEKEVWTGSCPCQPYSAPGKQKGNADKRHLWPDWFDLIQERRPATVFGEQVERAIKFGWLDGVYVDLEKENYAVASRVLPACGDDAPHKRDRLWFVAEDNLDVANRDADKDADARGRRKEKVIALEDWENFLGSGEPRGTGDKIRDVGHGLKPRLQGHCGNDGAEERRSQSSRPIAEAGFWDDFEWIKCADGKLRRIPTTESGIRLLVNGIEPKMLELALKGAGNGIVIPLATKFVKAYMMTRGMK